MVISNRRSSVTFSISQGTNICLVYVIDAYRPVAGEITLAVMGFKCKPWPCNLAFFFVRSSVAGRWADCSFSVAIFGFLLSFYTNTWVEEAGYENAFGAMAGIASAVLVMWVPLFVWGKTIRNESWKWRIVRYVHWNEDREVGE